MGLTAEGKELLQDLSGVMREIAGVDQMEQDLKRILNIKKVLIVTGNSDELPWVKNELGKACVTCIKKACSGKNIIAVTGGSTMASVAEMMTPPFENLDLFFVPARGGIGEDVQNQANTICSKMAEQTGSKHRVLYVPDQVSKEMYQSMIKEPKSMKYYP